MITETKYQKKVRLTAQALTNPQVGDRYAEFYSYWVYVVQVTWDQVTTLEASAPCIFPRDAQVRHQTRDGFRRRFEYSTIPDTYWITLIDRGNSVTGWLATKEAGTNGMGSQPSR